MKLAKAGCGLMGIAQVLLIVAGLIGAGVIGWINPVPGANPEPRWAFAIGYPSLGLAVLFLVAAWRLQYRNDKLQEQALNLFFDPNDPNCVVEDEKTTRLRIGLRVLANKSIANVEVILVSVTKPNESKGLFPHLPQRRRPSLHERGNFSTMQVNPGRPRLYFEILRWNSDTPAQSRMQLDPDGDHGLHPLPEGDYHVEVNAHAKDIPDVSHTYLVQINGRTRPTLIQQ